MTTLSEAKMPSLADKLNAIEESKKAEIVAEPNVKIKKAKKKKDE